MKSRSLQSSIEQIAFQDHKIAMVSGPRQCGKTTLAKMLQAKRGSGPYFNWDDARFRRLWAKDPASIVPKADEGDAPLMVLDEIHKDRLWKRKIKGIYDTLEEPCDILVTGSARLNVYRRESDSLLGRYVHFRLHPFTVRELISPGESNPGELIESLFGRALKKSRAAESALDDMMQFGPFPEPLLSCNQRKANVWRLNREHLVIREDLRDLSRLHDLAHVELMTSLLPERVGSLFSVAAIREDLEVSFDTVKRWMEYLKELFYLFELKPWSRRIPRTLKREGKVYLWDYAIVKNEAARFENLVASHLLKACHMWTDQGEGLFELYYLRDKQKREIDFLIARDKEPWLPVEVKLNNADPSPSWNAFAPNLNCRHGLQIVRDQVWKLHSFGDSKLLVAGAAEALNYFV